jgi:uncharacterized protein (TIGR00375 family)
MARRYADLHIHIGRSSAGKPIKVTAARDLTFGNIARECATRKGIDIAGIVDCSAPSVMKDIDDLVEAGEMVEQDGGGLLYHEKTTLLLGSELETVEEDGCSSHQIAYFGQRDQMRAFTARLRQSVKNLDLSSQHCRMPARDLLRLTKELGGMFVPAHAFTPHKGAYGACVRRLHDMFGDDFAQLDGLELGLSADSMLADRLAELDGLTFLSNSDAHSLPKIAREYNVLEVEGTSFEEVRLALHREQGRRVVENYGLDPRLGKYHRTFCVNCEAIAMGPPPVAACPNCDSATVVRGVLDRIVEIEDYPEPRPPAHRPAYHYQVPLQFLPGVGAVTLGKLLNRFGTEMAVLHETSFEELERTVGTKVARLIIQAREGTLPLRAGGGGHYGKAATEAADAQMSLGW